MELIGGELGLSPGSQLLQSWPPPGVIVFGGLSGVEMMSGRLRGGCPWCEGLSSCSSFFPSCWWGR